MKIKIACVVAVMAIALAVGYSRTTMAADESCCKNMKAGATCDMNSKDGKDASGTAKPDKPNIAEQKKTYPLETCVVLGNKLGAMGPAVDYEYKGRLVRFCCKGCIATFEKEPEKYLKKLDDAVKAKAKPAAK